MIIIQGKFGFEICSGVITSDWNNWIEEPKLKVEIIDEIKEQGLTVKLKTELTYPEMKVLQTYLNHDIKIIEKEMKEHNTLEIPLGDLEEIIPSSEKNDG